LASGGGNCFGVVGTSSTTLCAGISMASSILLSVLALFRNPLTPGICSVMFFLLPEGEVVIDQKSLKAL